MDNTVNEERLDELIEELDKYYLTEQEVLDLESRGLTLESLWDSETERVYWFTTNSEIIDFNSSYRCYDSPREAYDNVFNFQPNFQWPNSEILSLQKDFFRGLDKVKTNIPKIEE